MLVDVDYGSRVEDFSVNQFSAVWCHGEVLPAVMVSVGWVLLAQNDVFNPDSKLTVFVKTWLVRDAHAFLELDIVGAADALWTFMHVQVRTNSMASSVLVVKTDRPEATASQDVHIRSRNRGVRWPNKSLEIEISNQHTSIHLLLEIGRRFTAKMNCPRDVNSSVEILAT